MAIVWLGVASLAMNLGLILVMLPSQVDCLKLIVPGVSHLEYTPPWSGFWNVMTNENPGSRDHRLDLCAYKSYTDQVEGSGSGSYVAKHLSGSSGLEGSKSFFEPHLRIAPSYYPTTHRFGSTSSCKGGPQLKELVRESFKNYAKPTAITMVKSLFAGKEFAVAQSGFVRSDARKSEDSAKFDSFNLESPQLPIIDDCQIGDIGRTHSCFAGSSLTRMADILDLNPNEIDVLDQLLFSKFVPQTLCNSEKPSDDLDIHNPAMDSPCSRGAPEKDFSNSPEPKIYFSTMNGRHGLQFEESSNHPGKRFCLFPNSEPDFNLPIPSPFLKVMNYLSRFHHQNLVKLVGNYLAGDDR